MKNIVILALICLFNTSLVRAEEVTLANFMNWEVIFRANYNQVVSIVSRENPNQEEAVKNVNLVYMMDKSTGTPNFVCVQIWFEENGRLRKFTLRQQGKFVEDERMNNPNRPKPFPTEKIFSANNIDRGPE